MTILNDITDDSRREIYARFASSPFPFDIVGFGKALGLEIKESELPGKISGFIKQDEKGKISICVNKFDSPKRKRFTIAHEIGHYFLHSDQLIEGIVDGIGLNRDGTRNEIENQANSFAADLLMPESYFRELWQRDDSSVTSMADFFLVSESAIVTRAKFLQLIAEERYYGYFA
jgi:Zn-dependent peptidase ImmA (M78 family)